VPRWVWNSFGVVVYTVCALAGRNNLAEIFTNFLALMGYWVAIWIALTLEEQLIFRSGRLGIGKGWNWEDWENKEKLPHGFAALTAFLVGWAGAILCMAQVWYIGPIAKLVGNYGGDVSA
jgi:purine-cytosine permease-like protein